MIELHYYDKQTGIREFIDCRTKASAEKKLAKLKLAGKVDETKDIAICEFDNDNNLQ